MANSGFIKMYRSITEHWIYLNEKNEAYDRFHAWFDLLIMANYQESKKVYKGDLQVTKAGQLQVSDEFLAKRWCWSRNKTRKFLKMLENDGMISIFRTTKGTTITIENWGKFQHTSTTKSTAQGTTEGTTEGIHNKNNKEYIKNSADAQIIYDTDGYVYERDAKGDLVPSGKRLQN